MFCSTWRRNKETSAREMHDVMKETLREMGELLEDAAASAKLWLFIIVPK